MFFHKPVIPKHILVSRTDAMGDVILALPVCGLIKKYYPGCKVSFLGRSYTKSIALTSIHVDGFVNRDDWNSMTQNEIAQSLQDLQIDTVVHMLPAIEVIKACYDAKIKIRIGGMNKLDYLRYCNRIVRYSRKKSRLSEAQLNTKLLSAIGINEVPARNEIHKYYGFSKIAELESRYSELLDKNKLNLIIHPLSNKNAKEWGLHNFSSLIHELIKMKVKIFITGSEKEKETLAPWVEKHHSQITDLTGALNTKQLISFINAADGLIASSTGPVHIAAACGINTLGLYENRWIKRGERWGPIGVNASFIESTADNMDTISPGMVMEKIEQWFQH